MSSLLDPYELKRENDRLKQENAFLKQWISTLQKAVGELAKFQPPAPIVLTVTPEQVDEIRATVSSAADPSQGGA